LKVVVRFYLEPILQFPNTQEEAWRQKQAPKNVKIST